MIPWWRSILMDSLRVRIRIPSYEMKQKQGVWRANRYCFLYFLCFQIFIIRVKLFCLFCLIHSTMVPSKFLWGPILQPRQSHGLKIESIYFTRAYFSSGMLSTMRPCPAWLHIGIKGTFWGLVRGIPWMWRTVTLLYIHYINAPRCIGLKCRLRSEFAANSRNFPACSRHSRPC